MDILKLREHGELAAVAAFWFHSKWNIPVEEYMGSIKDKNHAVNKVFNILSPGGHFVLSIDKNQDDMLDFVIYKIKVYPDQPENIMRLIEENGFTNITQIETKFAYIFSARKPVK